MKRVIGSALLATLLAGCGGGGGGGGGESQRILTVQGFHTNLCGLDVPADSAIEVVLHDEQGNYVESVFLSGGEAQLRVGPTANVSVAVDYPDHLSVDSFLQVPVNANGSTLRVNLGKLTEGSKATEGCECTTVDVAASARNPVNSTFSFSYLLPDGAEKLSPITGYDLHQRQKICSVIGQEANGTTVLAVPVTVAEDEAFEFSALDHAQLATTSHVEVELDQTSTPQPYADDVSDARISLQGTDGSYAILWGSDGTIQVPQTEVGGLFMSAHLYGHEQVVVDDIQLSQGTVVSRMSNGLIEFDALELPEPQLDISIQDDALLFAVSPDFAADMQSSFLIAGDYGSSYYRHQVRSPVLTTLPELELSPALEARAEALFVESSGSIEVYLDYLNLDAADGYPQALALWNSDWRNGGADWGYQSQTAGLYSYWEPGLSPKMSALAAQPRTRSAQVGALAPKRLLRQQVNGEQVILRR